MPPRHNLCHRLATRLLVWLPVLVLLLSGCHYPIDDDHWVSGGAQGVPDSIDFRANHHYWRGFNFTAIDTLALSPRAPFAPAASLRQDTLLSIRRGTLLCVEELRIDTVDSTTTWVRLACLVGNNGLGSTEDVRVGWVNERALLESAVPNTPVSRFIRGFSDRRLKVVLSVVAACAALLLVQAARRKRLRLIHFNDAGSLYPTLLALWVAGTAVVYQSIQCYAPETWVEYYFHPTLNPLSPTLPSALALFVAGVWAIIVTGVAAVDDIRRRLPLLDALTYLSGLGCVCLALYLTFTLLLPPPYAYPALLAYTLWAVRRYVRYAPRYICGQCGAPLQTLGRCPHCGAINS